MAPMWPERRKPTLVCVPCAQPPAQPPVPPPPPHPSQRMEGLTIRRIQLSVLQEILPHLSARPCWIERCEVGDYHTSLGKGKASSGVGTFDEQMQGRHLKQYQDPRLIPCMLPSNTNSKSTHLLSCKLHPLSPDTHPQIKWPWGNFEGDKIL